MNTERQVGTVKVEFASNHCVIVELMGEHDLDTRTALRATLAYASEGRDVLVDLSQCSFIDSAIISLLLATQRTLRERNGRCELIIPPRAAYVTRLFDVTGITGLFRVHATRTAALSSIADPSAAALRRSA